MSTAALIVIALAFGIYAVTAAIIFGVSLQRLIPRLAVAHMENTPWFGLVKVANNAFLVIATGGFAVLFGEAFITLLHDNQGVISLAVTAIAIRWITKCYRAMRYKKSQTSVFSSLEAAMYFVLPVSIAALGVYCVLGHVFWLSVSGWVLMILCTLLLISGGCTFLYWKAGVRAARHVQAASRVSIGFYSLVAALVVQLVVRNDSPHLLTWPFALFIIVVACTLLWQGALMSTKRADHGIWWYVATLLFATPALFALANLPWILYGQYTVDQSFGGVYGPGAILSIVALVAAILLSIVPWILGGFKKR